jgi:4-hydroxy-3-methylbut-2-en-1-yl diphosphate synthase IspG/GcpE
MKSSDLTSQVLSASRLTYSAAKFEFSFNVPVSVKHSTVSWSVKVRTFLCTISHEGVTTAVSEIKGTYKIAVAAAAQGLGKCLNIHIEWLLMTASVM